MLFKHYPPQDDAEQPKSQQRRIRRRPPLHHGETIDKSQPAIKRFEPAGYDIRQ